MSGELLTREGCFVIVQAHKVRGDGGVAAGPSAEHDSAAYLLRRNPFLLGQQRQRALECGKIDLTRPLQYMPASPGLKFLGFRVRI